MKKFIILGIGFLLSQHGASSFSSIIGYVIIFSNKSNVPETLWFAFYAKRK